jgi:hypothetical protein
MCNLFKNKKSRDPRKVKPQEGDHQVFRDGEWVYEQVQEISSVPSELVTLTVRVGEGLTGFSKAGTTPSLLMGGDRSLVVKHGNNDMPFLVVVYRRQGDAVIPILAPYYCTAGQIHFDDYIGLVGVDRSEILLVFRGLK